MKSISIYALTRKQQVFQGETAMFDRRSLIKSAAGSMAGAFLAPAFASSVLSPDDKLMPVDTRNGRSGWAKPVKQVIQIKNCTLVKVRRK